MTNSLLVFLVSLAVVAGSDESQEARADRGAINITLNSFGGPLNEPVMRTTDRKRLYPAIGNLYPEATNKFQV